MEEQDLSLFIDYCTACRVGKVFIEKPKPFENETTQSFTFSCKADDNAGLRKLKETADGGMYIEYKVRGTMERRPPYYPRYPRKIKKALKKLMLTDQRTTRLMNKLMIKGL